MANAKALTGKESGVALEQKESHCGFNIESTISNTNEVLYSN